MPPSLQLLGQELGVNQRTVDLASRDNLQNFHVVSKGSSVPMPSRGGIAPKIGGLVKGKIRTKKARTHLNRAFLVAMDVSRSSQLQEGS